MFILLLVLSGGGYWYYHTTQAKIDTLIKNKAKIEVVAKTNQTTIDQMQADNVRNKKLIDNLNQTLQNSAKPVQDLRKLLSSHNLELLAEKKPGLIEKRINDASNKVIDGLRADTATQ